MRYPGLGVFFALALAIAAAPASASDDHFRDRRCCSDPGQYDLAHNDHRHYRDRKYRKHRKYRRHYRTRQRHHRQRHYDFHFYYGPHHYHHRHYRPYYLKRRCYSLHNDRQGDYHKWLAGAVTATGLIQHAVDNGDHETRYRARHNRNYSSL